MVLNKTIDFIRVHTAGLADSRFLRFLLAGGSGAALNIAITFLLTHFLLGPDAYFTAFLIGTAVNFAYNFTLYTIAIFKTRERHVRRFIVFLAYSILMTALQLYAVRLITAAIGTAWYLLVIATVIAGGAVFNYFVFKSAIFRTAVVVHAPRDSVPSEAGGSAE